MVPLVAWLLFVSFCTDSAAVAQSPPPASPLGRTGDPPHGHGAIQQQQTYGRLQVPLYHLVQEHHEQGPRYLSEHHVQQEQDSPRYLPERHVQQQQYLPPRSRYPPEHQEQDPRYFPEQQEQDPPRYLPEHQEQDPRYFPEQQDLRYLPERQEQDPRYLPKRQEQDPRYFPKHHVQQVQDPRYQQQQQVNLEQDGAPPGDGTFQFLQLPMFRHVLKPVVPSGLFRPAPGKTPFPDALTSLLFPSEALPPPPPVRKPQQPTVEVWCGDDKTVSVRVDRFRLGPWASPALFRLGSCSCSEVTPQFLYFHYKLSECQGTFTTVNGPLEYRNSLVFTPPPQGRVVRAVPLDLPIYCHYNRFHYSYKVGYRPQSDPKAYLKSIRTKRSFSLTVCDAQWRPLLPDQGFTLGETVNFVARTGSLLVGERLYVDSCFITASKNPKNIPSLHVITHFGCIDDSKRQGSNSRFWPAEGSAAVFSVDAFMFPGFTQQLLYLHCSMSVGSTPSNSSKSCTFNTSASRWEELEAPPSVCSCCDSVCREKKSWPSYVSPAVRSLISSVGWTVMEETPDGQQIGDTIRTKTLPHRAEDPWRSETTGKPWTADMTGEKDVRKYEGLNIPRESKLIPEEEVISGESSQLYSVGEEEWKRWKNIRGGAEEESLETTTRRLEVENAAHVKMSTMSQDNRRGDGHPSWMEHHERATGGSAGLSSHTSDDTPVRYAPAFKATELVYRFDTSSVTSTPGLISTSTSSVIPTSAPSFANRNVSTATTAIAGPSSTSHSTPTSKISSSTSDGTKGSSSGDSDGTTFDSGVSNGTVNVGKTTRDTTTASAVPYAPAYKATELVYRFDTSSVSSSPGLSSTSTSSVIPTSAPSFANRNVSTATTAIAGASSTSHSTPTSKTSSSTSDGTKGSSSGDSDGTRFDSGVSNGTVNVGKTLVPYVTHQSDPGTTVLGTDQGSEGHMSEAVGGLEPLASSTGFKAIKTGRVDAVDIRELEGARESSGSEDLDWASLLEQGLSGPVEGIPDNAPGIRLGRSGSRAGPDGFDESLWTKESELSTGPTGTSSDPSRFKVASSNGSVWTRWPESDKFSEPVSSDEAVSEVLVSGTGPVHSSSTVIVTTKISETHQSARGEWAAFESEQELQGEGSAEENPLLWLDGELLWNQLNMEPLAEEKIGIIGDVRFSDEEVLAKRREGGELMDSEQVERKENELGKEESKATEKEDKTGRGLWFKGMRRGRAEVLEQEGFRSRSESQWGGHRRPEQQEEVRRFLLGSKEPGGMPEDQVISGVLLEHTDDKTDKSWNLE